MSIKARITGRDESNRTSEHDSAARFTNHSSYQATVTPGHDAFAGDSDPMDASVSHTTPVSTSRSQMETASLTMDPVSTPDPELEPIVTAPSGSSVTRKPRKFAEPVPSQEPIVAQHAPGEVDAAKLAEVLNEEQPGKERIMDKLSPANDDEIRTVALETLRENPSASYDEVLSAWRVHRGVSIDEEEVTRVSQIYGRLNETYDAA